MKETRDLLKEWEGKEVYLIGTGNYSRRSTVERSAILSKVNRVKVKILFDHFEDNWRIVDNYNNLFVRVVEDNEYQNSGYMIFKDKESYQDYKKLAVIKEKVSSFFSGYSDSLRDVAPDVIVQIHKLLGLGEEK